MRIIFNQKSGTFRTDSGICGDVARVGKRWTAHIPDGEQGFGFADTRREAAERAVQDHRAGSAARYLTLSNH